MSDGIDVWIDDSDGNETRVFKARAVTFNTVNADFTMYTPSAFMRGAAKIEGDLTLEPGPGWDDFVVRLGRYAGAINEWFSRNIARPLHALRWESMVEGYDGWPTDDGLKRLAVGLALERYRTTEDTFDGCARYACYQVLHGRVQSKWIIEGGRRALRERVREIRGW